MTMSHKVYSVRGIEITNYSQYPVEFDVRDLFGFGQPLDYAGGLRRPGVLRWGWGAAVTMVADALGVELDEIRETYEFQATPRDIESAVGIIASEQIEIAVLIVRITLRSMTPAPSGYRDRNTTADRALTILGMFSEDKVHISASEVAAVLDCASSTAYRYLQTLVRTSFLEEAPGGGFRLGFRVMELARLARRSYELTDLALPVMRQLAADVGETVLLTRRVDDTVVCVDRCGDSGQLIRLSYERGSRLPINAGASALALLAWLPEDEQRELLARQPLQRFTDNTVTDVDALVRRLQKIRTDGYGVSVAEVDPDAMGIAAPIFDASNAVSAAVSVVAMRRRMPRDRIKSVVAAVRSAAQTLSDQMAIVES